MAVPKLVVTAALMAAQVAIGMSRKIKGPRLEDLSVSLADYGVPIPRVWGTRRINPQIIWADKLREKKKQSKTKGGKYAEYQYFGDWAVLLCDHEIDAVTRIWMDKRLVYQRTSSGPITLAVLFAAYFIGRTSGVKLVSGRNLRIYTGTEDQMPDPLIEAWCEDRYGPNSCPAYRGSAYAVFQNIPLEKFGNRLPQMSMEVVSSKTPTYPFDHVAEAFTLSSPQFSPNYSRLVLIDHEDFFQVIDTPTRTPILQPSTNARNRFAVTPEGIVALEGFPGSLVSYSADGTGGTVLTSTFDEIAGGVYVVGGLICLTPYYELVLRTMHFDGLKVAAVPRSFAASHYFEDLDGNAWAVGRVPGHNKVGFAPMPHGAEILVNTTTTGDAFAMCNPDGKFLVYQGAKLFIVDPDTWTAGAPINALGSTDPEISFRNVSPGAGELWHHTSQYDTTGPTLLQTVDTAIFATGKTFSKYLFDPINYALIAAPTSGGGLYWLYLDRIGGSGVTLQTVVDDVAGWCGLTGQDTSQLTQPVLGYSVTQGSGKDMIAPLFDIHDVDARPHDFQIQFVNRGSAPVGSISTPNFVREGDESRYTVTIDQDTDLPRRLTYNYADAGKDQQTNTAVSQRHLAATDSSREETIDLTTWVDTPAGAQQKGDRFLRRIWNSRERIRLSLTAQNLALEPGDVTTAYLDGEGRNVRLDKLTIAGSVLQCEFIRDEATVSVLNPDTTGADMEGRDPEVIYIPAPTKGFVVDGPLLSDADEAAVPVVYYGAARYVGTWPGAVIYQSDNGIDYDAVAGVDTESEAVWGFANTTLPAANPNLWDRGSSLNVSVKAGTLTSYTEAQIDANPALNLAYVGRELIQFATATLQSDGSYTLTRLKRGRRGTEWATHAAGESFVMASSLAALRLGLDDIGDDISFKAQTLGRDETDAPVIPITPFSGASMKPYAPTIQRVVKEDNGDLTITLNPRTRVGGNWNGSTIPTGETIASYEFDVYSGSTFKRTLTSSTKVFTYLAADQVTDFGSERTATNLQGFAYQLSATVGRGFARAA